MLLFRSEAEVGEWCSRTGEPQGAIVPLRVVWALAQRWYGGRLAASYRGRSPAEAEAIFTAVGLLGAFWRFTAP